MTTDSRMRRNVTRILFNAQNNVNATSAYTLLPAMCNVFVSSVVPRLKAVVSDDKNRRTPAG